MKYRCSFCGSIYDTEELYLLGYDEEMCPECEEIDTLEEYEEVVCFFSIALLFVPHQNDAVHQ